MHRRTALCLAIATLAGSACTPQAPALEASAATEKPAEKLTNVEVTILEPTRFTRDLIFLGEARPIRRATVASQVPGRIVALTKDEGESVAEGEVVARIDTEGVEADLAHAKANLDAARQRLKRLKPLRREKLVAEGAMEDAEQARAAADALLRRVKVQRSQAKVKAPIAGVVVQRFAEPGEYAGPGAALLSIADLSTVEVRIHVPEDQIRLLEDGKPVRSRIPALPELAEMDAEIVRLGRIGNPKNRTYPVDARLPNEEGRIRAGMLVEAHVTEIDRPNAIVVPRDAVVEGRGGKVAFVVVDDVVQSRPLELGPSVGEKILVKSGLVAGERLIVAGQLQVVRGERIRVIEAPASGDDAGEGERAAP